MGVTAILQARLSSRRLPGKVLKPLLGKPMLACQIERVQRAALLDNLVVATSSESSDDALADLCATLSVGCSRGSLDDVLDRFHGAVSQAAADHVVRLTGDCPLTDPALIDRVVQTHLETGSDYTANVEPPTWPDGLDVEAMKISALETAWREATDPADREHVTLFIRSRPERFRCANVADVQDRSANRWTVDNPEDFAFVTAVYEALYPGKPDFTMDDVFDLLEQRPQLAALNAHIGRNEGLGNSLGGMVRKGGL